MWMIARTAVTAVMVAIACGTVVGTGIVVALSFADGPPTLRGLQAALTIGFGGSVLFSVLFDVPLKLVNATIVEVMQRTGASNRNTGWWVKRGFVYGFVIGSCGVGIYPLLLIALGGTDVLPLAALFCSAGAIAGAASGVCVGLLSQAITANEVPP